MYDDAHVLPECCEQPTQALDRESVEPPPAQVREVGLRHAEAVGGSPMREYLEEHGNAVYHIGFNAGRDLERSIRSLEHWGARRVLGCRGDSYAHMDLRQELGLVIGLTGRPA